MHPTTHQPTHQLTALAAILAIATLLAYPSSTHARTAAGPHGVAATVQPIATEAAIRAFSRGGNAIDAAIAAAITLGVVDGHNSGLGGGCFILIRKPNGDMTAIDGREMAPAAATRDMFLVEGVADTSLSQHGPLAVGVPGAFAAYTNAANAHGKLPIADALNHAAQIASDGFPIDTNYARNLRGAAPRLRDFPAAKTMLLDAAGQPHPAGTVLKLPDLARSYRHMATHGTDWFYRGELAQQIGDWMSQHGGILTAGDFANYTAKERTPVRSTYRGYEIVGFPPPSSGGVHVAQILNILEHFNLRELFQTDEAAAFHVIAEAMKLAFADRAHWLGDADFAKVPRGLADPAYAKTLAARIRLDETTPVKSHGKPADWETDIFGGDRKHTTHIATADRDGNWVAITATVNTSFGSKVVVPGTGLVLNNEMDDFSAQPGVPNAFGLVGAEANAVAPGKRPLSSMSPTIVLKDGQPILTVGAAGGPKIITQAVLCIVNYLDRQLPLEQCIAHPRLHHQWRPNRLRVEKSFPISLLERLKSRGHEIETLSSGGVSQAIALQPDGSFLGVSDPRVPGLATGWTSTSAP